MSPRTCLAVRRRLSAFVDGELAVRDQIRVEAHLRQCASCDAEAAGLRELGDSVRELLGSVPAAEDRLEGLAATVVSRLRAERDESVPGRVERMFEDMHLLWAALGAAGATVSCVALMVGMCYVGGIQARPDSLSAVLAAKAVPGSDRNPVSPNRRLQMPSIANDRNLAPSVADLESGDDRVFALALAVTREGRISNLELLNSDTSDRAQILGLLDSIAQTRFEPARYASLPVAVNVVWLHAHLTVRGKMPDDRPVAGRVLSISQFIVHPAVLST